MYRPIPIPPFHPSVHTLNPDTRIDKPPPFEEPSAHCSLGRHVGISAEVVVAKLGDDSSRIFSIGKTRFGGKADS